MTVNVGDSERLLRVIFLEQNNAVERNVRERQAVQITGNIQLNVRRLARTKDFRATELFWQSQFELQFFLYWHLILCRIVIIPDDMHSYAGFHALEIDGQIIRSRKAQL